MSHIPSVDLHAPRHWWTGVTAKQWQVFVIVSGAWLFDTLDQRILSLARIPALVDLMDLPAIDGRVQSFAKVATAMFLAGWGVGGLTLGALGDRFGRVRMLALSVGLYAVGSGFSAICETPWQFAALRVFSGIGIGGVFGLAVAILADTVANTTRLAMLAALQILSVVGNLGAAIVKMLVDFLGARGVLAPEDGWRWLFAIGALPILLALWAWTGLREPEEWRRLKSSAALPRTTVGMYRVLFVDRQSRRNLLIGTLLAVAGVVGLWAVGEYAVDLQHAVFTTYYATRMPAASVAAHVEQARNLAFVLQMLGGVGGMLFFTWIAHRIGRRPAFIFGFSAAFITTLLVYWRLETPSDAYWMMPLMGAAQLSVFAGFSIYLPELFVSQARATAVSFAYNVGRFAAAAGSLGSALLTTHVFAWAPAPAPLRYAAMTMCVVFLLGVLASVRAPETRRSPSSSNA